MPRGVREAEDGRSERHPVMEWRGVEPACHITLRASELTSGWSYITRDLGQPLTQSRQRVVVATLPRDTLLHHYTGKHDPGAMHGHALKTNRTIPPFPALVTPGMGWCSTSLACAVLCHQEQYDAWVVSPVAEGGAPLAWPGSVASGSPQSAPEYACHHGPAVLESAVSQSPYHSGLGLHSPGEFLLACVLPRIKRCAFSYPWTVLYDRRHATGPSLSRLRGAPTPRSHMGEIAPALHPPSRWTEDAS